MLIELQPLPGLIICTGMIRKKDLDQPMAGLPNYQPEICREWKAVGFYSIKSCKKNGSRERLHLIEIGISYDIRNFQFIPIPSYPSIYATLCCQVSLHL